MSSMSATEMAAYLQQASPLLLDVREPWEFDICHIEGSINLPMGQIPQRVDDLPESDEIVVICHHGVRSQQVIRYLQGQMTASLINLTGQVVKEFNGTGASSLNVSGVTSGLYQLQFTHENATTKTFRVVIE